MKKLVIAAIASGWMLAFSLSLVFAQNATIAGGSSVPSGPAGGGLAGTYPNPTVGTTIGGVIIGQPYLKVHLGSSQSVTSGVRTKLAFDTVDLDSGSYWDASNKQFKPLVSGTYLVAAGFSSTGTFLLGNDVVGNISKNGLSGSGGTLVGTCSLTIPASSTASSCPMQTLVAMNGSTDTLEIDVLLAGTSPAVFGDNTLVTYMHAYRIGP